MQRGGRGILSTPLDEEIFDALATAKELLGRGIWIVEDRESSTVIGEGVYGGKPGDEGQVKFGYGITPDQRGKELAAEFAQELITQALSDSRVTPIEAGTLKQADDAMASKGGLEKLGFTQAQETLETYRWQLLKSYCATTSSAKNTGPACS